jgi:hypothetical protein
MLLRRITKLSPKIQMWIIKHLQPSPRRNKIPTFLWVAQDILSCEGVQAALLVPSVIICTIFYMMLVRLKGHFPYKCVLGVCCQ